MIGLAFIAAFFFDSPGWAAFWIVLYWITGGANSRCTKTHR